MSHENLANVITFGLFNILTLIFLLFNLRLCKKKKSNFSCQLNMDNKKKKFLIFQKNKSHQVIIIFKKCRQNKILK